MDGDGPDETIKPIDFCLLSPLQRQRIKDSWRSEPKVRTIPSVDAPRLVRKTPFGLSIPALKAKCSPHTGMLSTPKHPLPKIHYPTKAERELQKELEEEMTKEELKWLHRKYFLPAPSGVRKAALTAKITPRVEAMALAKLTYLNDTKKRYFAKLGPQQRNAVQQGINEHYKIFKANYPPDADKVYVLAGGSLVHASCMGRLRSPQGKKPRCLCELNKSQRKSFRKRMKQMGLPKQPTQQDKGPDRGPKKKIKEFEPWLTQMSQPRYNALNEKPFDPFKVKSSAKLYEPSERILFISRPRPPPILMDYDGNELVPRREWSFNSRKRIVASPRTIELAMPKFVKKKAAEDVKEDPFAVPRRALTAYCSPRIAELAEPVRR